MGDHTKYGVCKGCNNWKKRDDMLSINVDVYDENQRKEIVRIRLCPECHEKFAEEIKRHEWDNRLMSEAELRSDVELAEKLGLEFDTSNVRDTRANGEMVGRVRYL